MTDPRPDSGRTPESGPDSLARVARDYLPRFASPVALLVLMWLVQVVNWASHYSLTGLGLQSWRPATLYGLLTSPLLHAGWGHLIGNSVPFLVLGLLVAARGGRRFWFTTVVIAVVSGAGAFALNSPGTVTVGASGLVFGYFGYLLIAGFFAKGWGARIGMWAVALIVFGTYGASMFAGIFAAGTGVSWQGHLFGLLGGAAAAWLSALPRRRRGARDRSGGASAVGRL